MTLRCAVVGATGIAGQQFLAALADHPHFRVTKLAASARSAGKTLAEALAGPSGQTQWYADPIGFERFGGAPIEDAAQLGLEDVDLVFSAVETDAARELESRYAARRPVVSTASAFRYEEDVPVLIPAVNGEHAELVRAQARRGWDGYVVPIPNCTTTGLAIALAPLHRAFGLERVVMTSMQAVSGAGRTPGVPTLDVVDNIFPFIPKEEEKVARETRKLLGTYGEGRIEPCPVKVSATCTRVAVLEGHTESVVASFARPASVEAIHDAWSRFGEDIGPGTHPSAPRRWITIHTASDRPQVRLDRDADRGMTTSVGRARSDDLLGPHGVRFVLVSHNTKMGAATGAILVAEDLRVRGLL
jgi:aspartate-semialdehyde dehydrogenase